MIILGIGANPLAVVLGALVLLLMLFFRNFFILFLVLLLTIAINLPDQVLFDFGLDNVVLIAMVLFPTAHKMMTD